MAKVLLFLLLLLAASAATASADTMLQSEEELAVQAKPKKKLSHLHFYFHDVSGGSNPTTVTVAQAASTNASTNFFGLVTIMDDPLTVTPELNSTLVGRAQGLYAVAAKKDFSLLMAMNLAFVEGKYNGSTLALLGRNSVFSPVREMPIVGGSGVFRFAQGYALARTHRFDALINDAIIEYNVYVQHY